MSEPVIEFRETAPDERRHVAGVVSRAMLFPPPDDEAFERSTPSWEGTDSYSAWDGDRCVGHVGAYPVETLVPGGQWLGTSAVTRVGILPTYRRRGIADRLLTDMLSAARATGRPLASLRASEAVIYGRWGFGLAGQAQETKIDVAAARPLRGAATGGSFRFLDADEILPTVETIYRTCPGSPGMLRRPAWMWQRYFDDALKPGGDAASVVVHTNADGVDDGYASYTVKWNSDQFVDNHGVGSVDELYATTPGAELALWSFLFDLDLVRTWTCEERPLDDLLRFATNDPRAVQTKGIWDEQWLRLIDVDAALSARSYQRADGEITIGVSDHMFPDNDGVWAIGAGGARRDDSARPTLSMDVATLSSLYLGDPAWRSRAAIGSITLDADDTEAALTAATTLFATDRLPFCGSFF